MRVEDINQKLNELNLMENGNKNSKCNQCFSGPGAERYAEQPGQQALQNGKGNNAGKRDDQACTTLVFTHLPKDMTKNIMHNICSKHGKVKTVRDSNKNDYYFVELATVADMEAVFRALEHNSYGFKVLFGKNKNKNLSDNKRNSNNRNLTPVPPLSTVIDNQSRSYRTSNKQRPRPNVKKDSLLNTNSASAVDSGLPKKLLADDARSLERQGVNKMANNKFNYRNGRSNVNMPEKTKELFNKNRSESSGTYNGSANKLIHTSKQSLLPKEFAKCSVCYYACDTVCAQCSKHYCSTECQLSDWAHRDICGKPKHLQKILPPKIQNQFDKKSSENYKKTNNEVLKSSKDKSKKGINKNSYQQLPSCSNNHTNKLKDSIATEMELPSCSKKPTESSIATEIELPSCSTSTANSVRKLPTNLSHVLTQKTTPPKIQNQSSENSKKTNNEVLKSSEDKSKKGKEQNSYQQLPSCSNYPTNKIKESIATEMEQPSCSKSPTDKFKKSIATEMELPSCSTSTANSDRKLPTNVKQQRPSDSTTSSNVSKTPPATISNEKENMPRSGNIVTITAISKTNVVFIRSKTHDDKLSYFNTIDSLQAIGKMLHPLKSMPQCGRMVIAKFENQFNRALVLQIINPERILIIFVDNGNLEFIKLDDLCVAPAEFVAKPRHAIPVLLKDVPDLHMTQEIRQFMYSYLHNINVEIRYKAEDLHKASNFFAVELIDESTELNLNKMIIKLSKPTEPQTTNKIAVTTTTNNELRSNDNRIFAPEQPKFSSAKDCQLSDTNSSQAATTSTTTNEICNRGYLEQKVLPSGDNVKFYVMDNSLMSSGCVSCTITSYVIEIQKFQKELQAYAESVAKEAYTPRVDEFCIARNNLDGLWYRGLCLETVGDGHPSIHFIDYGNITIVSIDDIRRYPHKFTCPIYTADCEIKGLPHDCDDKLVAKLEQLIPNNETIKCENVTAFEEENFYVISLPNVIRELNVCGLLKNNQHVM